MPDTYKVWMEVERHRDGDCIEEKGVAEPRPVGEFDTLEEAEAFMDAHANDVD